jgi:hypothetical protein
MPRPVADPLNDSHSIASFVLLGTIGVLSFIVQPALVQGFVAVLHMTESDAVALAGVEMAGVAIATVAIALSVARVNWRVLTGASILVAAAGNAGSFGLPAGESLSVARFVAGVGHGGLISLSFMFVGLTRRVDRNLALYLVALLTYGAVGLWAAPTIFASVGLDGVFGAFAVVTLASAVVLPRLPASVAARAEPSARARQLGLPMLVVALASVLAYNLAQGVAWAILFLVGIGAGLGEQQVANALFASQVAAIAGAVGAVFLAERWSRLPSIVVGILGGALCIAVLTGPVSLGVFVFAVCGFNLLWNYVLPFILAAVGDMDLRGRMMSPAIAMQMIGLGLGPILSARLIAGGSYRQAEILCIAAFIASLLLLALPLAAHRRIRSTP